MPSRSSLLGATEVKLAPPKGRVEYLEAKLRRTVIKKVPRRGRECNETATNAELDISGCVVGTLERRLGCRFPWSDHKSSDENMCTDDKFEEFRNTLANIHYLNEGDIFGRECDPSCTSKKYEIDIELRKDITCREGISLCQM